MYIFPANSPSGGSSVTTELGNSYTGQASSNTLTVSNVDLGTAATDRISVI